MHSPAQRRLPPHVRKRLVHVNDASDDALGPSLKSRLRAGKSLRMKVPRAAHAAWTATAGRPDPIELLKHADRGRVRELLPIRYARMQQSSFAFFRGSAALMAADLAHTPATGIRVQACGDCHAANFGGLPAPNAGCCSMSTISTRRFVPRGNGTSSGLLPASCWRRGNSACPADAAQTPPARSSRPIENTCTGMRACEPLRSGIRI